MSTKLQGSAVLVMVLVAMATAGRAFADPLADATAAETRGDFAAAASIYRSLAEGGNVGAQNRLGYLYQIGAGVECDWHRAAEWYSKAAEAGDESAAAALSFIGRNSIGAHSKEHRIIYELVEKIAKMGNARAQFSLGLMNYPIGDLSFDETTGNLSEALIWYRRAAEQGDVNSEIAMALAYAKGIGVQQSDVEAYKWYDIAASLAKYVDVRDDVIGRRDELGRLMSSSQIAEARRLSVDWEGRPRR
jgi:TPR repeat protein